MKEQVQDMFGQITMPEETEARIRNAMLQPRRNVQKAARRMLATTAAVLALVFLISPQARAAVEGWVLKYVFPESGITVYEEKDENGNITGIMAVDTESKAFAEFRDNRLYYTRNGEERDITEQITENAPFYDIYEDEYGLTHYRAVGFSGSIENFGIYEFIGKEEDGQVTWEGGTGRNFMDVETESRYPWVDLVWDEWNIPWPKPE